MWAEFLSNFDNTVKLGFKELLNKEQSSNSDHLPIYLINSKQIGISEQFCDGQKVPLKCQVWLYK